MDVGELERRQSKGLQPWFPMTNYAGQGTNAKDGVAGRNPTKKGVSWRSVPHGEVEERNERDQQAGALGLVVLCCVRCISGRNELYC